MGKRHGAGGLTALVLLVGAWGTPPPSLPLLGGLIAARHGASEVPVARVALRQPTITATAVRVDREHPPLAAPIAERAPRPCKCIQRRPPRAPDL